MFWHHSKITKLSSIITSSIPHGSIQSIEFGEPYTPSTSPQLGVSVILSNPTFKPLPPKPVHRSSTPTGDLESSPFIGSWDNFLEQPTYQGDQFWQSRDRTQDKIKLVSTDVSDLDNSKESSDTLDQNCQALNHQVVGIKSTSLVMEENKANMESNIKQLELKVNDAIEDLDPDLITEFTAPHMTNKLEKLV